MARSASFPVVEEGALLGAVSSGQDAAHNTCDVTAALSLSLSLSLLVIFFSIFFYLDIKLQTEFYEL